ncbi:unnamed protein product [Toxocara canis]|uniref:Oxidored_molyb domain-containing protein n=1 Tax=Toxocara canis TaxID=6265 RepID=A0A183U6E0_TOXCA|nr:unnamed protein product [Toxocara canis]
MTTAGGSRERRYVNVEGGKCVTCPPMVSKRYPDWKLIAPFPITNMAKLFPLSVNPNGCYSVKLFGLIEELRYDP